jgi:hypothetical protein
METAPGRSSFFFQALPAGSDFVYHFGMKLEINGRGNGACPLCGASGDCRIHGLLAAGVADASGDSELEIVIYSCPYYTERKDA